MYVDTFLNFLVNLRLISKESLQINWNISQKMMKEEEIKEETIDIEMGFLPTISSSEEDPLAM